jgi:hypothetical protein
MCIYSARFGIGHAGSVADHCCAFCDGREHIRLQRRHVPTLRGEQTVNQQSRSIAMKKFYWCCILILGISVAIPARAESPALHGGALLSCSGLPCAEIALKNGKRLRMLVDLGDANTMVDSAVAKDLGLTAVAASAADTDRNANADQGTAVLEDVRLGDASLGDIKVSVADLASSIQKNKMPQVDGVLGFIAFHDRLVQIDYKRQKVQVSEPLTADVKCPSFCGDITMPEFAKDDPPVLVTTRFAVNGKPVAAQIDTLYMGTMSIYPAAVTKLNLQTESGVNATQFFKYTDGGVSMREGHARNEAFGSKTLGHNAALFFATPQVHAPDAALDGTVGAGLLYGHVVYIDLHSKHFWMTN